MAKQVSSRGSARQRAYQQLVSSLVSLFRVESEDGAERLRRIVPDPENAREAITAAWQAYREVVGDHPDPNRTWAPLNLARYLGDFAADEAAAVYRSVMERGEPQMAELAAVCLGELLFRSGDREGAAAVLDQVARQTGDLALRLRAFFRLGGVRLVQQRLRDAESAFGQAAEAAEARGEPHAWMVLANQTSVLIELGDVETAQLCLERLAAHPDPRAVEAAAALTALMEEPTVDMTIARATRRLMDVPCWYQTRETLHRNAGLLPQLVQAVAAMADGLEEMGEDTSAVMPFVDLLRRCERIGIDEALAAFVDLHVDNVPVDLRLLLLQVRETSRQIAGGEAYLLEDLHDGCAALFRSAAWEQLPPPAAFEGRMIAAKAMLVLESYRWDPDLGDAADRLLCSLPDLAVQAGRDVRTTKEVLDALAHVRRGNLAVSWLVEFLQALQDGTASEVLDRHPELLLQHVIDDLGERFGQDVHDQDGVLESLRFGVDLLRVCRQNGVEPVLTVMTSDGQHIMGLIMTLHTAEDGRQLVADHPELLTDQADLVLAAAEQLPGIYDAAGISKVRNWLRSWRVGGLGQPDFPAAPDEREERSHRGADALGLLLTAESAEDQRKIIEQHGDDLLHDDLDDILTTMIEREPGPATEMAKYSRSVLRRYRVFGPEPDAVRYVMSALLAPDDPVVDTVHAVLREHPGLLSPIADKVLGAIEEELPNQESAAEIAKLRRMLLRCTEIGKAAALMEAWDRGDLLDSRSYHLLSRATNLARQIDPADPSTLEPVVRAWTEALAEPMFTAERLTEFPLPRPVARAVATFHGLRHALTGEAEDADLAVDGLRDLVARSAEDDAEHAYHLRLLGMALCDRYDERGRADDLRDAVDALEKAENVNSGGDLWSIYADALTRRHKRFGKVEDLDRAIGLAESQLAAEGARADENHRGWNALSLALSARFYQTGRLDDLDRATAISAKLVAAPVDEAAHAVALANYGLRLVDQYNYRHDTGDLKRAVGLLRQANDFRGARPIEQARWQSTLGSALGALAEVTGQLQDLTESIALLRKAVANTPEYSFEYANRCNNLGAGLMALYNRTRRTDDLNAAIAAIEDGVRASAADAPGYGWRIGNLATALAARPGGELDPVERVRVGQYFRLGVEMNLGVRPESALRMARAWGERAADAADWETAVEAYKAGVQAVQRLTETQILREDYALWLHGASELFVDAADAMARAGRLADAVLALEQGRALVLSETLERDRAVVDSLTDAGLESLRVRFTAAVKNLRDLQAIHSGLAAEVGLRESALRAAHTSLRTIVAEVREHPGYEHFLRPPAFADVTRAATAPLCYLTAGRNGGWAILVRGEQIQATHLPMLTSAELDDRVHEYMAAYRDRIHDTPSRERWLTSLDDVTRWLWDAVLEAVVETAGAADQVVLVASGRLGFLPLHAAWRFDETMPGGRRYAIDDLLITYAPNARVLTVARDTAARVTAEALLVVGAPSETGAAHLPHAAQEAAEVHTIFGAGSVLAGADTNPERVLSEMRTHHAVHFSCHGIGEPEEPLNSALRLSGGHRLTLRELLDEPLIPRRLAVLSACETAVVGTNLPDEVIGLPSGLLQTGVAGVVASLWAVPDRATMLLVRRLYEGWRAEGLAPAAALRQAQIWLRDAGNSELHKRFPDITTPRSERAYQIWSAARPHTHPYHWASFAYFGA
ncbi:CHAT domain-containing protein [Lentzea sp. NPDC102401]|uniref:CHAT domain-containing protein n=1 Tax=Lentzea sp. NPDC102401 TaxID=3364128 RepID=UPI00381357C8